MDGLLYSLELAHDLAVAILAATAVTILLSKGINKWKHMKKNSDALHF